MMITGAAAPPAVDKAGKRCREPRAAAGLGSDDHDAPWDAGLAGADRRRGRPRDRLPNGDDWDARMARQIDFFISAVRR
jgi:hypothetical protein